MGVCESCVYLLYITVSSKYYCSILGLHEDMKACVFYRPQTQQLENIRKLIGGILKDAEREKEEERREEEK